MWEDPEVVSPVVICKGQSLTLLEGFREIDKCQHVCVISDMEGLILKGVNI